MKFSLKIKFLLFALLVIILFFLDLIVGSVSIPFKDILNIFSGEETKSSWEYIIFDFRLPKAITAILTGASLSIAGLLMQTLFRNPLAGPFVLGVSSGASLGVALYIMGGSLLMSILPINYLSNTGIVIAAIAGALLVLLMVITVGTKVKNNLTLLIVGIMFGSLTSAIVSILQYFSTEENVHKFVIWTLGSLSAVSMDDIKIISPIILISLLLCITMQKSLNTLLLGENYARSLGANIKHLRLFIICLTGLLAGTITAYTGPIAFVGIAIPHLARNLFKTSNHNILVPTSILIGAIFMLSCDIFSQLPGNNTVLPINSISAIFGAPIVIWIIVKRNV
jgi:iron complex transport system permease protein